MTACTGGNGAAAWNGHACLEEHIPSTDGQLFYPQMPLFPYTGALDDCELPPAEDEEEEGVAVDVQEPAATAAH